MSKSSPMLLSKNQCVSIAMEKYDHFPANQIVQQLISQINTFKHWGKNQLVESVYLEEKPCVVFSEGFMMLDWHIILYLCLIFLSLAPEQKRMWYIFMIHLIV